MIWFDVVFSFLVALFWLRWFRKKDKYEKEPERPIFFAFFAGVLATVPSVLLESFLRLRNQDSTVILRDLFLSFLWVGIVEEFFKYLAVRVTVYRSKEFNEVMDGMIYMASAALGFAATENVGYMLGFGYSIGFFRAIIAYLAHISFSAILGYYMAKAKIEGITEELSITPSESEDSQLEKLKKHFQDRRLQTKRDKVSASPVSTTETECDLRGMRVDEARETAIRFLDRAYQGEVAEVRIIHGYGTEAIKKMLREYLKESPYINSFRPGDVQEGGDGVTVVELKT